MAQKGHIKVYLDLVDKNMRKGLTSSSKMMRSFGKSITSMKSLLAGAGIAYGISKIVKATNEQIAAETKLLASFKARGGITKQAAKDMGAYAAELQKATRFGDEQIIRAQAMLGTFDVGTESVKKLTMGMLDMSEASSADANGMQDLTAIALTLGKALTGQVGMMARYGIVMTDAQKALIKLGTEEEKVASLAKVLEQNFGGAAVAMGKTFAGAQALVSNNFFDMFEKMGKILTQSGAVRQVMFGLSEVFNVVGKSIEDNAEQIGESIKAGFAAGLRAIAFFTQGIGEASQSLSAYRAIFADFAAGMLKWAKSLGLEGIGGIKIDHLIKGASDTAIEQTKLLGEAAAKTEKIVGKMMQLSARVGGAKAMLESSAGGGGGTKPGGGADPGGGGPGEKPISGKMQTGDRYSYNTEPFKREEPEEPLSFGDQMTENMQAYTEQATAANMATQAIGASVSAVGDGIATAIVDGGANWKEMMKSLLKMMISMVVQALLFKAIMGATTGGVGLFFHKGGEVGKDGTLKKYHSGGVKTEASEIPIMAQRGEGIVNRYAMRRPGVQDAVSAFNRGGASTGGQQTSNTQNNYFTIQALDGADLERTVRNRIIPLLRQESARNVSFQ